MITQLIYAISKDMYAMKINNTFKYVNGSLNSKQHTGEKYEVNKKKKRLFPS